MSVKRILSAVLLACVVAGCDDDFTPIQPTPPDPKTTTFAGTVTQNGAALHTFDVSGTGAVRATLKEIGADNTLVVGLDIGQWSTLNNTCMIVLAKVDATANSVVQGTMTGLGTLCVRVYDVGNIAGSTPIPYTVEVVHP